ncbi:MAG: hypothetical protein AAFV71_31045 [Cyanobacteria bacterium J06633_8]
MVGFAISSRLGVDDCYIIDILDNNITTTVLNDPFYEMKAIKTC